MSEFVDRNGVSLFERIAEALERIADNLEKSPSLQSIWETGPR